MKFFSRKYLKKYCPRDLGNLNHPQLNLFKVSLKYQRSSSKKIILRNLFLCFEPKLEFHHIKESISSSIVIGRGHGRRDRVVIHMKSNSSVTPSTVISSSDCFPCFLIRYVNFAIYVIRKGSSLFLNNSSNRSNILYHAYAEVRIYLFNFLSYRKSCSLKKNSN